MGLWHSVHTVLRLRCQAKTSERLRLTLGRYFGVARLRSRRTFSGRIVAGQILSSVSVEDDRVQDSGFIAMPGLWSAAQFLSSRH